MYLDPVTHDVVIDGFTVSHTKTKQDLITQKLKIKLLWFKEEWFLDNGYGIPYFQEIFVKGVSLEDIDEVFRIAISTEDGVVDLMSYNSTLDPSTRNLTVTAKVRIESGEILLLNFTV